MVLRECEEIRKVDWTVALRAKELLKQSPGLAAGAFVLNEIPDQKGFQVGSLVKLR